MWIFGRNIERKKLLQNHDFSLYVCFFLLVFDVANSDFYMNFSASYFSYNRVGWDINRLILIMSAELCAPVSFFLNSTYYFITHFSFIWLSNHSYINIYMFNYINIRIGIYVKINYHSVTFVQLQCKGIFFLKVEKSIKSKMKKYI